MRRIILRILPVSFKKILKKIVTVKKRNAIAMHYYSGQLNNIKKWIWKQKETSNFYYKLTPLNKEHLAHLISSITGVDCDTVHLYFEELENDAELRTHIENSLKTTGYGDDIEVDFGRRLGWYAFVRIIKPKVVVETGVDHGVGSCVLSSALIRNSDEGHLGKYFGTEIRTEAGQLFSGKYAQMGQILYGDSLNSLKAFDQGVDLFINDSDHSAEYEYSEYLCHVDKLLTHNRAAAIWTSPR